LDITEAIDSGQSEYFLGPMVLKKQKGSDFIEIIDGQQRIATIYILLSVIRRIFRDKGDDKRADWFNNEYFGNQDFKTLEVLSKFTMNEINDPYFKRFVVADSNRESVNEAMKKLLTKDSNFLLLQAITNLWDFVKKRQSEMTGENFDLQTLSDIERFVRNNLNILFLIVTDEADAYIIFETLNDRGIGLTTMDLLKNHIFGKSGKYLENVKRLWTTICDNLADIDPRERFLYHYWTSLKGRTSKNKLFRIMRECINDSSSALDFAQELSNASKVYSAMSNSGHPFWNNYDQQTRENIDALNLLDAQQALPILLAAVDTFDENEYRKLTKILVVMAVRYNLICEERTGVLANYYVEIPPKIRNGELTRSAKVFRNLVPIYPSDADFKVRFSEKSIKNSRKARYILGEIEKFNQDDTLQVVSDTRKINLEHILPKNPSQEWSITINSIKPEDPNDYIYRIGNLALVNSPIQKQAGAKGFEYKKNYIFSKENKIKSTNSIACYSSWTKNEIDDRQRKLSEIAVKVWRVDIE
jgi:uncharacterized protein with ParB-like and HNH nuclease domain